MKVVLKIKLPIKLLTILFILFNSINISAQDIIKFQGEGIVSNEQTNEITKLAIEGYYNAKVQSLNVLNSSEDGNVEFKVSNTTSTLFLGLSPENKELDFKVLAYSFYLNNDKLFIFENGILRGFYGNIVENDVLKIKRIGTNILYTKNDIGLRNTITDNSYLLMVDLFLINQNSAIKDLKASFKLPLSLKEITIQHISSLGLGAIDVTVDGGLTPYSYNWSNNQSTEDLTSLSAGEYTLTLTDANANSISRTFSIAYYPEWKTLIGLDTPSLGILKKNNNDEFETVFAGSENVLGAEDDGWFEFKVNNPESKLGITFNRSNPLNDISLMNFGLYIVGTRVVIVQNNRILGSFGSANEGDVIKIGRDGTSFFVYKNNEEIYSIEGSSEENLFINVAMEKNEDKIDQFVASFHTKMEVNAEATNIDNKGMGGAVKIEVDGGVAPYSYAWRDFDYPTLYASISNPSFTLSDMTKNSLRTGMSKGKYVVDVSDNNGQLQTVYVSIGKAELVYYTGNIDYIDKKYQKIGADSWDASAVFSSKLLELDKEGSIALKINNPEKEFVVGYRDDLAINVDTNNIDSADLLLGNGATEFYYLHIYNGKINALTHRGSIYLGEISQDDKVFIKRERGVIYFGKNGEVLHQQDLRTSNKMYALLRPFSDGMEVEDIQFIFLDENN